MISLSVATLIASVRIVGYDARPEGRMTFVQLFGAVLAANLVTVWFVYCFYHISKHNEQAPSWALMGAAACALFAGLSVYLSVA